MSLVYVVFVMMMPTFQLQATASWSVSARPPLSALFLPHLQPGSFPSNGKGGGGCCLKGSSQGDLNSVAAEDGDHPTVFDFSQHKDGKMQRAICSFAQQFKSARTCASELIALFSGAERSATVDVSRAQDLVSCVRLLVPLRRQKVDEFLDEDGLDVPWSRIKDVGTQRGRKIARRGSHRMLERMIRWPPRAVLDLSRKAVESGGNPATFMAALSPVKHNIPDIEGSVASRCSLTKYDYGLRFVNAELNTYMAALFQAINVLAPSAGINVSLSRYDLFHGHVFLAHDTGRLGVLFHAREYPAFHEEHFPINLGWCQKGSNVVFDQSMDLRNIVWLAPFPGLSNVSGTGPWLAPGSLFILDAHPGGVIFKELVSEYLDIVRTISEYDFGIVAADLNYFNDANYLPGDRILIC